MQKSSIRQFFTNPLSVLCLAGLALFVLFGASAFPEDFFMGQAFRFVAIVILLSAGIPCLAWVIWRVRGVYHDKIKGVPDDLSSTNTVMLTVSLYIAIPLCYIAAALFISV